MSRRCQRTACVFPRLGFGALVVLGLLAGWQGVLSPADASARTIHFQGHAVQAPPSWPVYRLARHPGMCVRLDRRAVYLGTPAADQRCPAEAAVGRRRAILVDPGAAAGRGASASALPVPARPIATTSSSGSAFTGLGFDACSTPSTKAMASWGFSPYRAIGIYIGGANRACSQPNLTASWVGAETGAGWHLIPTYVGLQAPTSSCGSCAKLSSSQATAQGTAAAVDAVAQASVVAIGPGSPIYFDMESYSPGGSASAATLTFLEAWTNKLHSLGYLSGVYSSSASGIVDLAGAIGSGYTEPDDLWIANWNGQQNTIDPVVPANAWNLHQRIHQYQGGHNETYGGTSINIDNDYVDGATVGTATLASNLDDPVGFLDLTGSPAPGQVRVKGWAFDPDIPTEPLSIRVDVGGKDGAPGVAEYELGPVASRSRADVASKYPTAGGRHGFDASLPTLKSGPQTVCVYAVNSGLGADSLLGCKRTGIAVAITLSHLKATARGVRVRIACAWPAGTECPGQVNLRTRIKVAVHRRHQPPRIRVLTRSLGRRAFRLTGAHAHGFLIPFSSQGRSLLGERGKLKTQLIAAIPGGKKVAVLGVGG
jgi:Rv2525c-like, glycoside hydrolase-like domain